MIELEATKNRLLCKSKELLTSGSVNSNQVQFTFSADWDGLTKTAVFRCGGVAVNMLLGETNTCLIPWEVLETPNWELFAGVFGVLGEAVVLPTVWASLGAVRPGTTVGKDGADHTPDAYQQLLGEIGDLADLKTEDKSSLVAALNEVRATSGAFETDKKTLTLKNGVLSVNCADAAEEDNTLPITSAAVFSQVGNIDVLLKTI